VKGRCRRLEVRFVDGTGAVAELRLRAVVRTEVVGATLCLRRRAPVGYGVLGTLEVVDEDGEPVDVAGGHTRVVLVLLLAAEGRLVPADALIDALWGEAPPASAAGTLQSYISRLRRALEPDRAPGTPARVLVSEGSGYRLVVDPGQVDLHRFEALADEGASRLRAGDPAGARERLLAADRLWRGPALADCPDRDLTRGLAARLEERRVVALEDRVDADLALGRHDVLVGELAEQVGRHPLRERLRAQLALALYRSGRQAEALRAIEDARRTLVEELGVDPGPALRDLEARILDHDPSLDPPAAPAGAPEEIEGGPASAAPPPAGSAGPTPGATGFVGRRAELGQLLQALQEAQRGARFAVIEGQPGIGKTRLAEELAQRAATDGAGVLWGRSLEGDAAPAFWPWLSVLRPLAARSEAVGPRLGQLLGLQSGELVDPGSAARFELFDEVVGLLAGAGGPVVVLDDVQWADPASLELLGFLAGRLQEEPVLLVATVRELELGRADGVVDALAAIARRPGSRRLRLRGLGTEDTAALIRQATGQDVPASVVATIHERAEGNPFYATELAQLLSDVDDLADPAAVARARVPTSVRDVVRQRLSRLSTATAELLQVCAVIGREADVATVAAASGVPLVECLDQLEEAVRHRLLLEVRDRPGAFAFTHALVREVVLDDLTSLRRARLHLAVADAVEATATGDDVAEILAEHLWAASAVGVGRRAADALQRAGRVAVRRLGYESADDLLERSLQLRRAAGTSPEDQRAELSVLLDLLSLRRSRAGYAALADDPLVDAAVALARSLGDDDALLTSLYLQWSAYDTACRYREGTAVAEQILVVGGDREEPYVQHFVHQVQGIHAWHLGRITAARDHLDLAAAVAPEPQVASLLAVSSEMWMLANAFAAYIHDLAGDLTFAEVEARFEALARPVRDPFLLSLITTFAAAGGVVGGDPARAARWGEQTLAVDERLDFAFWNGISRAYLGAALVDLHRPEEGLPLLRAGAEHCVAHGIRTNYGSFVAIQAMGEAMLGQHDEAQRTLDSARAELASHGEQWPRPLIHEADAVLAATRGEPLSRAEQLLEAAADEAVSQGSLGILRRLRRTAEHLGVEAPRPDLTPPG
jgi:DNA-binding SARP family transcriptional activator